MSVKFEDIEQAYHFVSSAEPCMNSVYLSKETGQSYYVSDEGDSDELPDDIEDGDKYLEIPDKYDLDLGQELVWDFVRKRIPDAYDEVRGIFGRRGAYSRYKDFLFSRDLLDNWHHFEEERTQAKLMAWCKENHVELAEFAVESDLS